MASRRLTVLLAAAAGCVLLAAGARGADSALVKTIRIQPRAVFHTGWVMQLAANGLRAAVVTRAKRGCGPIVVWTAPGKTASRFALGELGCNGDGVDELALGGGQVGWIELGGGNDLEMTVMAGRLPRGRTKQLEYQINGDRAGGDPHGGWVGNLVGSGSLLAYNGWNVDCNRPPDETCGDGDPQLRVSNERLTRISGGRATVTAPGPGVLALAAAGGGRLAVLRSGGVATIRVDGQTDAFVPEPPKAVRAVRLTQTALLVEKADALDVHDPRTGALVKTITLGTAAPLALVAATQRYALVHMGTRTALVRLTDGAIAAVEFPAAASHTLVDVRLTDAGLFYAYDPGTPKGRQPGRVAFVPIGRLTAVF